jgi:hypothetical protein
MAIRLNWALFKMSLCIKWLSTLEEEFVNVGMKFLFLATFATLSNATVEFNSHN